MRKARPRKAITRSSVEIRSYSGTNDSKNEYILGKGHLRGRDYFNAFLAHELKGACIDILGLEDSEQLCQKTNANQLRKKVWYGQ